LDGGPNEGFQNAFEFWVLPGGLFELVEGRDPGLVHGNYAAFEYGPDEILLAAKMIIDGGEINAGFPGDVPDRNPIEALFTEQLFGDIEDARPRILHRIHTFV
jgi:hypothetical protein